jgi:phage/conjugal plasmid C-4 type zinc finger TraR family protein
MDIFDQAQANDELFRQSALNKHFAETRNKPAEGLNHSACRPSNLAGAAQARICEDCGNPIPAARLKVNPQATRCIGCQEKIERRNKNGFV